VRAAGVALRGRAAGGVNRLENNVAALCGSGYHCITTGARVLRAAGGTRTRCGAGAAVLKQALYLTGHYHLPVRAAFPLKRAGAIPLLVGYAVWRAAAFCFPVTIALLAC